MNDQRGTHSYHNNDHTRVGAQGSVVNGGVHFYGSEPAAYAGMSRRQQIEELRRALAEAHTAGDIDTPTHTEAAEALDEASQHADAPGEDGQNAFVRALRKVKGLVDEVGGLVAAVAAVIATVAGVG